ncbi:MAG: hypothetical protein EBZ58_09660 [Bacteroidetes bacterium]|nr:hypothetical protein [Bacteroidota bacterium]
MTKFNLFLLKLLLVILPSSIASSQNCTDVKELFRKRHIISEMTYGHPYTTFDRHNANYKNLDNAIDNIRKNIPQSLASR